MRPVTAVDSRQAPSFTSGVDFVEGSRRAGLSAFGRDRLPTAQPEHCTVKVRSAKSGGC